ncbi:MAG: NAD(+) diphosphatase [Gammaproteobacteria bacterium]|nr:NAD(+) diphosphatase [Gammaproteobacteria bacterium]
MSEASTRYIPVWRTKNLFTHDSVPTPMILSRNDLDSLANLEEAMIFLGEQNGVPHFAIDLPDVGEAPPLFLQRRGCFHDLRQIGAVIDRRLAALLGYARAMASWHSRNRYCTQCGSPTLSSEAGHVRRCTNSACYTLHFPRIDPAIIVLVVGTRGCLLGRNASWDDKVYSAIAGFVEPGESLEDAAIREVWEETGVEIANVRYQSSQPWPFPNSIMLGFTARATHQIISLNDAELEDARWFTRRQIKEAVTAGALKLPNHISIAYRLVEDWFNKGSLGPLEQFIDR